MKRIQYEGRTIVFPQIGDKVINAGNTGVIVDYKNYFYLVDFGGRTEWCLDDQFKVI